MTTAIAATQDQRTQETAEIERLYAAIVATEAELSEVQAELVQVEARIFADSSYTFTLIFPGGQVAPLEVRGASSQEHARAIAHTAFKTCRYEVVDGDQTHGHAQYCYLWCSRAAQETQPYYSQQQAEA